MTMTVFGAERRTIGRALLLQSLRAEQTMGMPAETQRWTADEVRSMQDESRPWPRYELIDGELLVSPAPSWYHQRAVGRLWRALDDYVRAHRLGEALMSPADIELEPERITQPDVFVVPESERRRPPRWADVRHLLVAAEVLSPSTARFDRVKKRRYYQRRGVPEYWVVDLDARVFERWRPGDERPEFIDEGMTWHAAGAPEPFVLDLRSYFAGVYDEAPDAPP